MLHLRDVEGVPIAVGDALGFPVEHWQMGDSFVQRHQISIPLSNEPGKYTIVTNIYWLENLEPLSPANFAETLDIQ